MVKKEVKVKEKISRKKGAIDIAIDAVRKGSDDPDIISWLGDYKTKSSKMEFISTGSIDLDRALVRGGIPTGRIVEIYGIPSSGKSTVAMEICKSAQKKFPDKKIVYCDSEMAMDPDLPINMGLDPDNFILIQSFTGNESLAVLEKLVASGEVSIAVVDSVDSLLPKSEDSKTLDDPASIGNLPQLMSRACRRFAPLCRKTNSTILFINQTRQKIMSFGDPETVSGGMALGFYASIRLRVSGSGETKKDRVLDSWGNIVGHKCHFVVRKNKLGPPYRAASATLRYGLGFDYDEEIINLSVDLGIVEKSKNGVYKISEGCSFRGEDAYRKALTEDNNLKSTILEKINALIQYKPAKITEEVIADEGVEEVKTEEKINE